MAKSERRQDASPPPPRFSHAFGELVLERRPQDTSHTLLAWDAADTYLLDHLREESTPRDELLIFNDSFGALTLALAGLACVTSVSDSVTSQRACLDNATRNRIDTRTFTLLPSTAALPNTADQVIMKLPKSLEYFSWQLHCINHYLPAGTPVVIGAMVKYLSNGFFKLAEQHLAGFHTTLAVKKARLLVGTSRGNGTLPNLFQRQDYPEFGLSVFNTPNVFAGNKLDIGSRFFLEHFPTLEGSEHLVDLGCGNGILAFAALNQHPELRATLVDESFHAVAASQQGLAMLFPARPPSTLCLADDTLDAIADGAADIVLNNPPFHQQQAIGTRIAQGMFRDSARILAPKGRLIVIGNRHLDYPVLLKRDFRQVRLLASNSKFVLLEAR